MMRLLWLLILAAACKQPISVNNEGSSGEAIDPHSYANNHQVITKHLDLDITVDFNAEQVKGKATWQIDNLTQSNQLILDTWKLQIDKVTLGKEETPTGFKLGVHNDILGQPLEIEINPSTTVVNIYYTTSKEATALQWLKPQQTAGKQQPFLFTQSQAILARSWIPCQDGPAVRFTYTATVKVPTPLMAVMSAENPQVKQANGMYRFVQPKPIPSYLMALAVGDLVFKPVDHRTGVYAEPSMVEKAAWEFADMGKMVDAAENMYGPYQWGRFDVLVLPPSFPFGGMENPMLTFATPTVIAGDRSLVALIAHELAHSWSGNLVTNATWEDMWMNEGFTVYVERRIIESLYGRAEFQMQEVLGRWDLENTVEDKGDSSGDTRLKLELGGRDPDEGLSDIAYEKGYSFLRTIEEQVGRTRFDAFLKDYFTRNAFQSKTTEDFIKELKRSLGATDPAFDDKLQLREWIYGTGIPSNIPAVNSPEFEAIDSLIDSWQTNKQIKGLGQRLKSTNELLYFIRSLPPALTTSDMAELDKEFNFTRSGNSEIQAAWYLQALKHEYKPAYPFIENFLTEVGRRKFLRPLYKAMIQTTGGKEWAKRVYAKARANYHPVSYHTIDEILK